MIANGYPTSNICGRSFSISKNIRNPLRNRLLPMHLEGLMFLTLNFNYWDEKIVSSLLIPDINSIFVQS